MTAMKTKIQMSRACAPAIGVICLLVLVGTGSTPVAAQSEIAEPQQLTQQDYAALAQYVVKDKDEVLKQAIDQAHADCFKNDCFPSAKQCAVCHPQHYREWSVSPHAYAQLSPVFNAMSNKLNKLNNGTLGDFCIRCHTPVGMAINEPMNMSNLHRHPAAREGVTCVTCHRINQAWGKGAGRQALVPGDIHQAVYGPIGSRELNKVLSNPDHY
ncbi:MAG TPA: hypothetical protein DIW81_24885, partial [Planctomycetaceae bacterium]|nr:hypothetical protein [Planctomycetaceae bacterium]